MIHYRLNKYENQFVENNFSLELFALNSQSQKFELLFSENVNTEKNTRELIIPVTLNNLYSSLIFKGSYKNTLIVIYAQAIQEDQPVDKNETKQEWQETNSQAGQCLTNSGQTNNLIQIYLEPNLDLNKCEQNEKQNLVLPVEKLDVPEKKVSFRFESIYQSIVFPEAELKTVESKLTPEPALMAAFSNISPSLLLITNEENLKEEDNPQLILAKIDELAACLSNMVKTQTELLKNDQMMLYFSTLNESVSKTRLYIEKNQSQVSRPFFFETNLHKNNKINIELCEALQNSLKAKIGNENEQILGQLLLSCLLNSKMHVDKFTDLEFVVNILTPVFKEPTAGSKLMNLFFDNFYLLLFNKKFRQVLTDKTNESIFSKYFDKEISFDHRKARKKESMSFDEDFPGSKNKKRRSKSKKESFDSEPIHKNEKEKNQKIEKTSKNQTNDQIQEETAKKQIKVSTNVPVEQVNVNPVAIVEEKRPAVGVSKEIKKSTEEKFTGNFMFKLNLKFMLESQSNYILSKFRSQHEILSLFQFINNFRQNVQFIHKKKFQQKSALQLFEENFFNLKQIWKIFKKLTQKNGNFKASNLKIHDEMKASLRTVYQTQSDVFSIVSESAQQKERTITCSLANFLREESFLEYLLLYLSSSLLLSCDFFELTFQLSCRLLFYICQCKGGIPFIVSNKSFMQSWLKFLKNHYESDNLIFSKTKEELFNKIFQKDVYIFSKFINPIPFIEEVVVKKDFEMKARIATMAGQNFFFYANLNTGITLLDSVSNSLLSWDNHHELLINLVQIDKMIQKSCLAKQAMLTILKEEHFFDTLILILKVENTESFERMRFEISIVCKIIYHFLRNENFKMILRNYKNLREILTNLDLQISEYIKINPYFQADPESSILEMNMRNLKSIITPFEKFKEDFTGFLSGFQGNSRYTHTNIATLLSNKQHFMNVEREFPKSDQKKYFTRLNDYLAFFKTSDLSDNKINEVISYLKIIGFSLSANPTLNQIFVTSNTFDIVNFIALIAENILSSFLGSSQLNREVQKIYEASLALLTDDYLDLIKFSLKILAKKTSFKEKHDVFGKEYENTELFFSILNLLGLFKEFKPNYFYELCIQRVFELNEFYEMGDNEWKICFEKHKYMKKFKSFCFSKEIPHHSVFLSKFSLEKISNLFFLLLKFMGLFAKFPGSYDTLLSELLFLIFSKNSSREVLFIVTANFISEPRKWKHKEKIKKIIQTLLFDKVRTAKRSKVVLIQKYGSTRSDSMFDIFVTQNGYQTTIECLIYSYLTVSDKQIFFSFGFFLMTLIEWKDPIFCSIISSTIKSVFKHIFSSLSKLLGFSYESVENNCEFSRELKSLVKKGQTKSGEFDIDKITGFVKNLGKICQMLNMLTLTGIFKICVIEEDLPTDMFSLLYFGQIFDCFKKDELFSHYLTLKLEIVKLFRILMNEEIGFTLKIRDGVTDDKNFTEIMRKDNLYDLIEFVSMELNIDDNLKMYLRKNSGQEGDTIEQLRTQIFFKTLNLLKMVAKNPITKNICCFSEYSRVVDSEKKPLLELKTISQFIFRYAEQNQNPDIPMEQLLQSEKLNLNQFSAQRIAVILDYYLQTAFLLITQTLEDSYLINDFTLNSLITIFFKKKSLVSSLDKLKVVVDKIEKFNIPQSIVFRIKLMLNSLYSYHSKFEKEKKKIERFDPMPEVIDIKSRLVRYNKQFFRFEESAEELAGKRNFLHNFFNYMHFLLENKFLRLSKQKNFCRESFTKEIQYFLDLKC